MCFDFETVGKITNVNGRLDASTVEPVQLAAVAIDPVTMSISRYGGVFDSLMCPEGDWRDRVDPGALMVNKIDPDDVAKAPPRRDVWMAFDQWVAQFNPKGKGKVLTNPIPCGKHLREFDCPIVEFLAKKYGTCDDKGLQKLFHRRPGRNWGTVVDLEDFLWAWFEGPDGDLERINMDEVREYFGLETRGAHTAVVDVYQTAEMICRFLRVNRRLFKQVGFRNSLRDYKVPGGGHAVA